MCMCVDRVWGGGREVGEVTKVCMCMYVYLYLYVCACACMCFYVGVCMLYVCVRVGEEEGSWGGYCGLISNQ